MDCLLSAVGCQILLKVPACLNCKSSSTKTSQELWVLSDRLWASHWKCSNVLHCLNRPLPPPCTQFRQLFATENDHSRVRQNWVKVIMSVAIVTNMYPELASRFTPFKWRSSSCQVKSMISQGSDIKCIDAFGVVRELNWKRYFKGAGSNHNIPKTSNAFPHIDCYNKKDWKIKRKAVLLPFHNHKHTNSSEDENNYVLSQIYLLVRASRVRLKNWFWAARAA